jgi:predicted GIY-YIG superfamily endonuclease
MSAKTNCKFESIRRRIRDFPNGPGLYLMKGPGDQVLYVGKAKNLRSRVASYFQHGAELTASRGPKIAEMIGKVKSVDFLETSSEVEAVLAEARLIKDIRPPYNTDLVDDKTFPYLEITTREDYPGVYIKRCSGSAPASWTFRRPTRSAGFSGRVFCTASNNVRLPAQPKLTGTNTRRSSRTWCGSFARSVRRFFAG